MTTATTATHRPQRRRFTLADAISEFWKHPSPWMIGVGLVASDYKPRTGLYQAIWKNHRQHHFKNEHYWFTVTSSGSADRVLGTHPDATAVATSPTAKNLHAATPG